ncbi:hypothetical protein REMIM1_CH02596 [Rhizobium etli bv. mimosae str. Mim1]|nr:hypothetical protein REMIM1_CH02596 [Rhizobium etli bv. mimosae str. Mim1]
MRWRSKQAPHRRTGRDHLSNAHITLAAAIDKLSRRKRKRRPLRSAVPAAKADV